MLGDLRLLCDAVLRLCGNIKLVVTFKGFTFACGFLALDLFITLLGVFVFRE
jgi:hypothetical protein